MDEERVLNSDNPKAQELASLMSEISEEYYCAGWIIGLEFSLWEIICNPENRKIGFGAEVELEQVEKLTALSKELDGWIVWKDDYWGLSDLNLWGNYFLPMTEWLEVFSCKGVPKDA